MNLLGLLPDNSLKKGWPWDKQVDETKYLQKKSWPKISIITPTYNQGNYIEETIRSILLQNYPNLEYIIIDGGSTDETVEIIKKYAPWISYWISEPDGGQADAINKGLKVATGEIINWLNSDDFLLPDALYNIATEFKDDADLLAGSVNNFYENGVVEIGNYVGLIKNSNLSIKKYFAERSDFYFHQPGVWYKKRVLENITLNENLHYCFDTQLILKLLETEPKILYSDTVLVNFRLHSSSKTTTENPKFIEEFNYIHTGYLDHADPQIAADAELFLNRNNWNKYLNNLQSLPILKVKKVALIIKGMLNNPKDRFNRFSLGCIRKVLYH